MNYAALRFVQDMTDESGVTAIEYGLVAALIAMGVVGAIGATGTSLTALYAYWSTALIASL